MSTMQRDRWTMKLTLSLFTCLIVVVVSSSSALCEGKLKCGKEYRFTTKDGKVYQGKLRVNNGSWLTLGTSNVETLKLSDIAVAHRVKRNTLAGAAVGCLIGTAVGLYVMDKWREANPPSGWMDFQIAESVGITLAGTFVGCIIGGVLGSLPTFEECEVDVLPLCVSGSGESVPLSLRLTYEF